MTARRGGWGKMRGSGKPNRETALPYSTESQQAPVIGDRKDLLILTRGER